MVSKKVKARTVKQKKQTAEHVKHLLNENAHAYLRGDTAKRTIIKTMLNKAVGTLIVKSLYWPDDDNFKPDAPTSLNTLSRESINELLKLHGDAKHCRICGDLDGLITSYKCGVFCDFCHEIQMTLVNSNNQLTKV